MWAAAALMLAGLFVCAGCQTDGSSSTSGGNVPLRPLQIRPVLTTTLSPPAYRLAPSSLDEATRLNEHARYQEALPIAQRAVKEAPASPNARYQLARAYEGLGDHQRAAVAYRQALAARPDDREALFRLGFVLEQLGRFREAADAYRQAVARMPDNADAHYNLAHAEGQLGQWANAVTEYRAVLRINPNDPDALNSLGDALFKCGDTIGAAGAFRQAIALDPGKALYHANLGAALLNTPGEAAPALAELHAALRLDPYSASAWNDLAWHADETHHPDDADDAYRHAAEAARHALAADASGAAGYANLGYALAGLDRWQESYDAFSGALQRSPHDANARRRRAWAALILGEGAKAADDADTFLKERGWSNPSALSIALVKYFGQRLAHDDTSARQTLADAAAHAAPDAWPAPALHYLAGNIDAQQLLAQADTPERKTDAETYLGVHLLLTGHRAEALTHFETVVHLGLRNRLEYHWSKALADRLTAEDGHAPPTTTPSAG